MIEMRNKVCSFFLDHGKLDFAAAIFRRRFVCLFVVLYPQSSPCS